MFREYSWDEAWKLALTAKFEAANRSRHAAGRRVWNDEDRAAGEAAYALVFRVAGFPKPEGQ